MMLKGINNEIMARYNQRLFLFLLYCVKESSISRLSELSGLSIPAVSRIAQQLEGAGKVRMKRHDGKRRSRGHQAGILCFADTERHIICMDVRPKEIHSMVCDVFGKPQSEVTRTEITMKTKESLQEMMERIILHYRKGDAKRCFSAALAFHGQVDHVNGVSLMMPQAPWHEPFHVKFLLERSTGLEVRVDNDCVMRALAQKWFLLRRDLTSRDFCILNLDYGIGSSFMINSEIYRGSLFGSGQIGHTIMDPYGRRCSCGRTGCLETEASLEAIFRKSVRSLRAVGYNTAPLTVDDIMDMYLGGNEVVRSQVNATALAVGLALYNFLNVMNINRIYIYGKTCGFGQEFLETIRKTVMENPFDRLYQIREESTSIEYGTLSPEEQLAGISYLYAPVESVSL